MRSLERGRDAQSPVEIPKRGWLDIAWRVKDRVSSNRISLVAAGVAFFGLLALFPAIGAVLAIGGLLLDPQVIVEQMVDFRGFVPDEVLAIVQAQASEVAGADDQGLGLAALVALGLSFWSASRGMAYLVMGLNLVYDEEEKRGFFRLSAQLLAMSALLVFGFLLGVASIIAVPALLSVIDWPLFGQWLASGFRWVVLVFGAMVGLALIYRYGPSRSSAEWSWVTPGSVIACLLWIAASVGFTIYVGSFASYNESFGALGGVVILIMWLWISAFIILLGGLVNAEMEAQTRVDTTIGPDQPIGERGAAKADKLGEART
ncbi:YihY/virulence factor BrkB family protein [Roseivivax sp. THAF197b]|uniref:YihY/virulence factor BrkB family protein n=1 Tax=Roseivivax sp. THAF197b TaxID=2588299 RepID=UPI001268B93C|nr:YihY/virulence factor BrkB family protein [Roseivivax sp. THAF197b]QFS85196.1 hypothetical protein FIV09_20295 [Roseivivax sp. THAF197b]